MGAVEAQVAILSGLVPPRSSSIRAHAEACLRPCLRFLCCRLSCYLGLALARSLLFLPVVRVSL